jgi:hypothetical protein
VKIPSEDGRRLDLYVETREACLASRQRRMDQYSIWRRYFLYGNADGETVSAWNMIYDGLDLLSSFLYAVDQTRFWLSPDDAAPKADMARVEAVSKRINKRWKKSGCDVVFMNALMWSFVYDSAFVKCIRRAGRVVPYYVDPASFGVYREDIPTIDNQEAFAHTYYITMSDLERRLLYHPRRDEILKGLSASQSKDDLSTKTPPLIDRVLMSSVTPSLVGEANMPLQAAPDYRPELPPDLVEMSELWVWDDENDDYQTVTMAGDSVVVYDRPNIFLPRRGKFEGDQPFRQVCPNPLPDYFFGQSEVGRLAPIQEKLEKRLAEIDRINEKEVDPPTGFTGQGLIEEKLEAMREPGSMVSLGGDGVTNKRETVNVTVPQDIYRQVDRLEERFLSAMGLSNVLLGRGEAGVRSAGHAAKLATLGSSRAKKRGLIIEGDLEECATVFTRCLYVGDDTPLIDEQDQKFILAQMDPNFCVEVDAHSNSPVFREEQKDTAALLFKARAIDRKRMIQLLAPPREEELVRDLEEKIIPAEEKAAAAQLQAEAAGAPGKKAA